MSSIDWSTLHHAYGVASDIPDLLAKARTGTASDDYRDEPWFSLWSSLAHQGDVYSASYAAVPELVTIAHQRNDSTGIEALLLAACIEVDRHGAAAAPMPVGLQPAYHEALVLGLEVCHRLRGAASRPDDPRRLDIAAAAFSGDLAAARRLLDEDDSEND